MHFLLQDMQGALTARYDSLAADVRSVLRDQKVNVAGVERSGMAVAATFNDTQDRDRAISTLRSRLPDLEFTEREETASSC